MDQSEIEYRKWRNSMNTFDYMYSRSHGKGSKKFKRSRKFRNWSKKNFDKNMFW